MKFDVLTIFPDFFASPLGQSITGKAVEKGIISVNVRDIRMFAADKHRTTDDAPYGGGPGMVMKTEPVVGCLEAVRKAGAWTVLTSAKGMPLTHSKAKELSAKGHLVIVCGRYEGIDERVAEFVDEEVSIGDYVLSGGEVAALVIMDAVSRFVPGVLGNDVSLESESYADFLLEYPQYTRPEEFRGMRVPDVLTSGDHAAIEKWRRRESLKLTYLRRPDLLDKAVLNREDVAFLVELGYKRKAK